MKGSIRRHGSLAIRLLNAAPGLPDMTEVRVELFGGCTISDRSGRPIPIPTRKARLLLAYLAMRSGQSHSRDQLVGLLWPDRGEDQARGSLRQALAALRRALGPEIIVADRNQVSIAPGRVWVDALHFDQLVDSSDSAHWDEAAGLYNGSFLDGVRLSEPALDDWSVHERARLLERAQRVLFRLLGHQQETGVFQSALDTAYRMLALNPVQEEVHRALMRIQLALGQRGRALQQFEACKEILAREVGVDPDPETEALARAIRDGVATVSGTGPEPAQQARGDAPKLSADFRDDGRPALVVLPFDNLTGHANQDYVAEGITGEITTGLASHHWITVISRYSALSYRDKSSATEEIARELGVRYVLDGSYSRDGDHIRIHTRLIDAATRRHVWAERYGLEFKDLFSLFDEVAEQVVLALQPTLMRSELSRAQTALPREATTWQLFIRAQNLCAAPGRQANGAARELLLEALEREPGTSRIYATLAATYLWEATYGWAQNPEATLLEARDAAMKAIELDPFDSWAYSVLGAYRLVMREHARSIEDLRRAVAFGPSCCMAHASLAMSLAFSGECEEAVAEAQWAQRLSPNDHRAAFWFDSEGVASFGLGRFEDALAAGERAASLRPQYPGGYRIVAASSAELGRFDEAREAVDRLTSLIPGHTARHARAVLPFAKSEQADAYIGALEKAGLPAGAA